MCCIQERGYIKTQLVEIIDFIVKIKLKTQLRCATAYELLLYISIGFMEIV